MAAVARTRIIISGIELVAGPYRASRIVHELAAPLPAPPAFFDFPKGPDKTGAQAD